MAGTERTPHARFDTREAWLNFVAESMGEAFYDLGAPLPANVRIAIGFTSKGIRGRAIGECWTDGRSEDGHHEIFIRPDLAESSDLMPLAIAAILAHELVHAAVGIEAGHGPKFKRVAVGLGLEGKMRATVPGPRFMELIAPILVDAGPLPHGRLNTSGLSTAPKKQSTRMLKCECEQCGYTTRTARKWIEEIGPPICPQEGHGPMKAHGLDDDADGEGDE